MKKILVVLIVVVFVVFFVYVVIVLDVNGIKVDFDGLLCLVLGKIKEIIIDLKSNKVEKMLELVLKNDGLCFCVKVKYILV